MPKAPKRKVRSAPPPVPHWQDRITNLAIKISALSAGIAAISGAYLWIGLPTLATSADIKKLSATQAEIAVDVYAKDVRDSIILRNAVKNDKTSVQMIDENIRDAKEKLKAAQERRIELAK